MMLIVFLSLRILLFVLIVIFWERLLVAMVVVMSAMLWIWLVRFLVSTFMLLVRFCYVPVTPGMCVCLLSLFSIPISLAMVETCFVNVRSVLVMLLIVLARVVILFLVLTTNFCERLLFAMVVMIFVMPRT